VNLSDLAAKGARPMGVLLGFTLGEAAWDKAFADGLGEVLRAFGISLLGGDTVSAPTRVLGLTAIGQAARVPPNRSGASPGDQLWVSGTIGDAGAGLQLLRELGDAAAIDQAALVERYRNPRPRLEAGERLVPLVKAMMDVSDGLLIDTSRMAEASGCRAEIELETVPLSEAYLNLEGEKRLEAATAGDDYELLFAAAPDQAPAILALSEELGLPFTRIGAFAAGSGLALTEEGAPIPLPERLGFEHG
jgi:thiamine-monophosphate kinase